MSFNDYERASSESAGDLEFIVERITVVKFGVDDRGSNGTGTWGTEVMPDTTKLTNVIVTGFGEM